MAARVHNIPEIMRRTGLSREGICRLRAVGIIVPVGVSPLGRPLFPTSAYARIERAEQLRELGMTVSEIQQAIAQDDDALVASARLASSVSNG